jgi:hypothetical protein
MKKIIILLIGLILIAWSIAPADGKDLEIQGKKLISQKPPFTLMLPSESQLFHSYSHENPAESSLTRVYFVVKDRKNKQIEEMFIVQIADKTNPQAGPIVAPPLKAYTDKRMYLKDKKKKGELVIDYLIQLMAWNPDAPSLQPIVKKGIVIQNLWALQGQSLFIYQGEHAVFIRYSKAANAFGFKVSEEGDKWNRESISGNEKKTYEAFQKSFIGVIDSIRVKNP